MSGYTDSSLARSDPLHIVPFSEPQLSENLRGDGLSQVLIAWIVGKSGATPTASATSAASAASSLSTRQQSLRSGRDTEDSTFTKRPRSLNGVPSFIPPKHQAPSAQRLDFNNQTKQTALIATQLYCYGQCISHGDRPLIYEKDPSTPFTVEEDYTKYEAMLELNQTYNKNGEAEMPYQFAHVMAKETYRTRFFPWEHRHPFDHFFVRGVTNVILLCPTAHHFFDVCDRQDPHDYALLPLLDEPGFIRLHLLLNDLYSDLTKPARRLSIFQKLQPDAATLNGFLRKRLAQVEVSMRSSSYEYYLYHVGASEKAFRFLRRPSPIRQKLVAFSHLAMLDRARRVKERNFTEMPTRYTSPKNEEWYSQDDIVKFEVLFQYSTECNKLFRKCYNFKLSESSQPLNTHTSLPIQRSQDFHPGNGNGNRGNGLEDGSGPSEPSGKNNGHSQGNNGIFQSSYTRGVNHNQRGLNFDLETNEILASNSVDMIKSESSNDGSVPAEDGRRFASFDNEVRRFDDSCSSTDDHFSPTTSYNLSINRGATDDDKLHSGFLFNAKLGYYSYQIAHSKSSPNIICDLALSSGINLRPKKSYSENGDSHLGPTSFKKSQSWTNQVSSDEAEEKHAITAELLQSPSSSAVRFQREHLPILPPIEHVTAKITPCSHSDTEEFSTGSTGSTVSSWDDEVPLAFEKYVNILKRAQHEAYYHKLSKHVIEWMEHIVSDTVYRN